MSPSASDARSCHPASPGPPIKFKSFSAERPVASFPRHRISHRRAANREKISHDAAPDQTPAQGSEARSS
jgi:hypothetical protein